MREIRCKNCNKLLAKIYEDEVHTVKHDDTLAQIIIHGVASPPKILEIMCTGFKDGERCKQLNKIEI